jgi:hypothetical protein
MRVSFLGNVIRYGIDIGAAAPLVVDSQNLPGKSHATVGDAVTATWRPDDAVAFAHGSKQMRKSAGQ